ncbi:hypothetical protein [Bacteroides sp.]|uniref:hypothetical protein n=1 Tax=Bacteroides sp. TaxID=29523 RepID=UPI0025C4CEEC|nr:hypothetical protein [Bacteroides sp.]
MDISRQSNFAFSVLAWMPRFALPTPAVQSPQDSRFPPGIRPTAYLSSGSKDGLFFQD